jgi:hypothetical protein
MVCCDIRIDIPFLNQPPLAGDGNRGSNSNGGRDECEEIRESHGEVPCLDSANVLGFIAHHSRLRFSRGLRTTLRGRPSLMIQEVRMNLNRTSWQEHKQKCRKCD